MAAEPRGGGVLPVNKCVSVLKACPRLGAVAALRTRWAQHSGWPLVCSRTASILSGHGLLSCLVHCESLELQASDSSATVARDPGAKTGYHFT